MEFRFLVWMEFLMKKYLPYIILLFIAVAILSCSPTFRKFETIGNSPRDWTMFRNSLDGYYQRGIYGSDINMLRWKAPLKARSYSTPVATESYVAVGALDSYMYFFDVDTGERVNIYKFGAPLSESPMISNKIIYAASGPRKNYIAGLNLITGKYIFKEKMRDVSSPIVADERYIYVGDYTGRFVCMDKFAGKVMWEYQTEGAVMNAPAVKHGRVFVGSLDQNMYAFDSRSGELLWSHDVESAINSAPAVDSLVYFGDFDGTIHALRAEDGSEVWSAPTNGHILSSPVIDDGYVYIGSNDRHLYCLDKATGRETWSLETDGVINSTPLVLEDAVVIASGAGTIYILDKFTGDEVFVYETENEIKSSPIYFDGNIFISSLDKHLYCFSSTTANKR
jgi:outer membrane protein assembly factor BamB